MLRVLGGVPAKLSGREFCSSRRVIVVRVSLWESSLEVLSKWASADHRTLHIAPFLVWLHETQARRAEWYLAALVPRSLHRAEHIPVGVRFSAHSAQGEAAAAVLSMLQRVVVVCATCSRSTHSALPHLPPTNLHEMSTGCIVRCAT